MENLLSFAPVPHSLNVVNSYLDRYAHEWWIVNQQTEEDSAIIT